MTHTDERSPERDDQRMRPEPRDDAESEQPAPDRLPDGTNVGSSSDDSKRADREGD